MKKILIPFALFSLTAYGQKFNDKIKSTIENSRTSEHINIPGTRVFIIPPPGFAVAKTFVGLEKSKDTFLSIQEIVGGNFDKDAANFNRERFEPLGNYQEVQLNGFPAKFVLTHGTTKHYVLVFGDDTFLVKIMAQCALIDEEAGEQMIAALNSICYDKNTKRKP